MKKFVLFFSLIVILFPAMCYASEGKENLLKSKFDSESDLTRHFTRKQVLNGSTTKKKKIKEEIYLTFPFENSPYMFFANFVLNGPVNNYSGFIETIYYRDNIKIKDMYYENRPVKTDKIGIYSTDLCFTSEEGVIYHYKNVPYLVSSDRPTIFFSEINYDKENARISGKINMPKQKNTFQVELFYTDNEEYHYQEAVADKKGRFNMKLTRDGQVGKMYLRVTDGLGNYADAYDILHSGISYPETSANTQDVVEYIQKQKRYKASFGLLLRTIAVNILLVLAMILSILRLRVIVKRKRRRKFF
ncbi:hypothetical protein [Candidatus Enterococcus mansonii]|uniref:Carboxypeptidase regulatory-like domain-containing protein n=1 Tax=Candidatus Enterococcus mansonii TaxID=1834181 RepID=A0A242C7Q2_9ENTE|nr:hypothetical protein [Enterococcus sp. 4G2_DIV0659]OTO05930.1 hypothetical protein A5880_003105 [Enterococcus sp. 4G2_DIV0659]